MPGIEYIHCIASMAKYGVAPTLTVAVALFVLVALAAFPAGTISMIV